MDSFQKFVAVSKQRKQDAEAGKLNYSELSKKKLRELLKKKLQTSFIGAVSEIEKSFGFLWKHGEDLLKLTPDEKRWREAWEKLRNLILTNGNNQIRGMESELERYTVTWNRYSMKFERKEK